MQIDKPVPNYIETKMVIGARVLGIRKTKAQALASHIFMFGFLFQNHNVSAKYFIYSNKRNWVSDHVNIKKKSLSFFQILKNILDIVHGPLTCELLVRTFIMH